MRRVNMRQLNNAHLRRFTNFAIVVFNLSCSVIVKFDPEERPCNTSGECLSGYTCLINRCVSDGSITLGETCNANEQCENGAICPAPGFLCSVPCDLLYAGQEDDCSANQVCVRVNDSRGVAVGACMPSECDTTCRPDGTTVRQCSELKPGVKRCMQTCSVTCTGATCTDTCQPSNDQTCQPIDTLLSQKLLICVPEGAVTHGQLCNGLTTFCQSGAACVVGANRVDAQGVCINYCDPAQTSACTGLADPNTGTSPAPCLLPNPVGLCGSP